LNENKTNDSIQTLLNNILITENDYDKLYNNIFTFKQYNNVVTRKNYLTYNIDTNITSNNIFNSNSRLFDFLVENNNDLNKMYSIQNIHNNYYLKIKLNRNNNYHKKYINCNIYNITNNVEFNYQNTSNFMINNIDSFINNINNGVNVINDNFIKNNCLKNIQFINNVQSFLSDNYIKIIDFENIKYLYFTYDMSYLNTNYNLHLTNILNNLNSVFLYIDPLITDKSKKTILLFPDDTVTYNTNLNNNIIKQGILEKLTIYNNNIDNSFNNITLENILSIININDQTRESQILNLSSNINKRVRVFINITNNNELNSNLLNIGEYNSNNINNTKTITPQIINLFTGFVNNFIYSTELDKNILDLNNRYNLFLNLNDFNNYKNELTIIKPILDTIVNNEKSYISNNNIVYDRLENENSINIPNLFIKLSLTNLENNFLNRYPKIKILVNNIIHKYNENNKNYKPNDFIKNIYTDTHTDTINYFLASYFNLKKKIKENIKYNDDKTNDEINKIEYKKLIDNKDILKYIDIYNDPDILFMKDYLLIKTENYKTGHFYDEIKNLTNDIIYLNDYSSILKNDLINKLSYTDDKYNYYLINMKKMNMIIKESDFGFMKKFISYINEKYKIDIKTLDFLFKTPDINQNKEILKIVENFNYEYIKIVIILIIIITIIMNVFYREYIRYIR